jgi:hypothetical protein
MTNLTRSVLTTGAMLMGIGAAAAQAPGPRPAVLISDVPATSPPFPARSPQAVIERVMSFDANKDGRISRDELPERMQELIARGDTNADAALDSTEVRALVTAASSERVRVAFSLPASEGFPGVIKDLKLPPDKHERALVIVSAYKLAPTINHNNGATGSDAYREMRVLLDDEEYENFLAAASRLSRSPQFRTGTGSGIVR